MKRGSSLFLRMVVVIVGIGALALLLWEPHTEGRNAHATTFEIYFKDPFLAYVYVGSIPFFLGLGHAFKVLGYAGRDREFSLPALHSLRTIKWCAIALVGFVAGAELMILFSPSDDRAGGLFMGVLLTFAAIVVATAMSVLERALASALDLKSENDLTV